MLESSPVIDHVDKEGGISLIEKPNVIEARDGGGLIGKLNFSLKEIKQGELVGVIDFLITSNYQSTKHGAKEVQKWYADIASDIMLGSKKYTGVGAVLVEYFIFLARRYGCERVYIYPDSPQKKIYWKEKIGTKLLLKGIIQKVYGNDEICFEL